MTTTEAPPTTLIPLNQLEPSPTNPRKHFDQAKLAELADNIRRLGVLQPLLVRPNWCIGSSTPEEANERGKSGESVSPWQIVAGERRYSAALNAGLKEVPCAVRVLTDPEAMEIQLVENLQRDDLTPIEEAQGFHDALQLKIGGRPVYDAASLAAKISKSPAYVYERLKLLPLPKFLRDAVEHGHLPVAIAHRIARIPDKEKMAEAGKKILNGHGENIPLTRVETAELLQRDYMRELKGAPFDQADGNLLPDAGPCGTCALRSGNIEGFEGKRTDLCTSPGCFQRKVQAALDRAAAQAKAEGKVVLNDAEAAKVFDPLGEIDFRSTMVRPAAKPRDDQLKPEVKRAPTWAALAESARKKGFEVPVYAGRNPKTGVLEDLIDSAPLIKAAAKIGEPIFRGGKDDERVPVTPRAGEDPDEAFRRGQREHQERQEKAAKERAEEERKSLEVLVHVVRVIHAKLADAWKLAPIWSVLLRHFRYNDPSVQWLVQTILGKKPMTPEKTASLVLSKTPDIVSQPLVPLLLMAAAIRSEGIENSGLRDLAKLVDLDLKKTDRAVRETMGQPAAKKPAKPKPKPAARGKKGGAR